MEDVSYGSETKSSMQSSLGHDDVFDDLPAPAAGSRFQPFDGVIQPEVKPTEAPSVWSLAFYQSFFDVTTTEILSRLWRSLVPIQVPFYAQDENPDLYGPFWICTTLIFLLAAAGNFAEYLSFKPGQESQVWKYDFEKVTLAATMFYSSLVVWPIAVYMTLRQVSVQRSLVEIISLYGYSFTSYIFTCLLCLIPGKYWSIVSVSLSFVISVVFIIRNLLYILKTADEAKPLDPGNEKEQQTRYIMLGCVVTVHLGVALSTKFYFFNN